MESLDRRMLLAGLGVVGAAAAASAGAGTLNPPPGPVAPTGKTTNEIEPRIAVQSLPGDANNSFIIAQPGSYYLTGNINGAGGKNGISIQADGVTLDLTGFALIGEATGSGIGVSLPVPRTNLCVRNGTVRNWRSHGVGTFTASSSVLEGLRAFNNLGDGLQISNESLVRDCVMTGNIGRGLFGDDRVLVSACVADTNTGSGIALGSDAQVIDCLVARGLGNSVAILVADRCTISRCTVSRNAGTGIQVGKQTSVADCNVAFNSGNGIVVDFGSTVRNCNVQANTSSGIKVSAGSCSIIGNTCDYNAGSPQSYGIEVIGTGSRIDGNSCSNNSGGFLVASQNLLIRNSADNVLDGVRNDWATQGGSTFAWASVTSVRFIQDFSSTQPWTNFSH